MWHILPPEQLGHLTNVDTAATPIEGATEALVRNPSADPGDADEFVLGTVEASGGGGGAYAETIGDGVETSFVVTHDLDTTDVVVQLWDLTGTDPELATGDADSIEATDADDVTVTFSAAPDTDAYRVVVLASGSSGGGGGSFAGASVRLTSDQSGISHDTPTALIWQAADFDVGGITDIGGANPSRLTVTAGKWAASATVDWQPSLGDQTILRTSIAVNGTILRQQAERTSGGSGNQGPAIHDVLDLADGDYVEIMVSQLSNSSQTVRADVGGVTATFASLVKVG